MLFYKSQAAIVYQLIERIPELGGMIAQMDAGLGKTRVALAVAKALALPVVVIVPTNLIDEWQDERLKLDAPEFKVLRNYAKPGLTDCVLASYACLNYPKFAEDVNQIKRLLIVDELANFKNEDAQRTKQLRALTLAGTHLGLGLTATLIENELLELFTQLSIVAPRFMSRKRFINRHVVYNPWGGVGAYEKLGKFRKRAKKYICRLRRDDVKDELPSQTQGKDYIYFIEPPQHAMAPHMKLAKKLVGSLGDIRDAMALAELSGDEDAEAGHRYRAEVGKITSVRRITKLRAQLCDLEGLGRAKLDFIYKLFKRWSKPDAKFSGFPCLIFCDDVEQAEAMSIHIEASMHEPVGLITGQTPFKERRRIRQLFNTEQIRVLVCSAAGSRGSNLPAGRSLIHYSIPWNDAVLKQRNRIQRTSSTVAKQRYILLVLRGTVDEYLLTIVRDKAHQAQVFDVGTADKVKSRSKSWTEFLQQLIKGGADYVETCEKASRKRRNKGHARGYRDQRFWSRKRKD